MQVSEYFVRQQIYLIDVRFNMILYNYTLNFVFVMSCLIRAQIIKPLSFGREVFRVWSAKLSTKFSAATAQ
jgi:hypothetical protein